MNSILSKIPPMLMGEELERAMEIRPAYDKNIRNASDAERLVALSDMYGVFIPNLMAKEIYSKIYLAMLRSLQKKQTKLATKQMYENYRGTQGKAFSSIINSADCFSIIGPSGVGKSASISRAVNLVMSNKIIEIDEPYTKLIPCVVVQTPFDSSVKGLLLSVLRTVDEMLGTKYYANAIKARATTDMLVGSVANVALNHIGLLVIDETQHIVNHKSGKTLMACLTQLINTAGISLCFVATPEVMPFFEQAFQLARRTLGLTYQAMEYGEEFRQFCEILFQYQYVQNRTEITDGIIQWLYEHSSGNLSVIVSLIHDAQEIAILEKQEVLNIETLNIAYKKRLAMLHSYISPKRQNQTGTVKIKKLELQEVDVPQEDISIKSLILRAKNEGKVPADYLGDYIVVERVKI